MDKAKTLPTVVQGMRYGDRDKPAAADVSVFSIPRLLREHTVALIKLWLELVEDDGHGHVCKC